MQQGTGITPDQLEKARERLTALCREIIADDLVEQHEAETLQDWLDEHEELLGEFPANVISARLCNHLADGKLDQREAKNLLGLLRRVVEEEEGNVADRPGGPPYDAPLPAIDFCAQPICLAGQFAMGTNEIVGADVRSLGGSLCDCADGPEPAVLAIGYFAGRDWLHGKSMAPERDLIEGAIRARAQGAPVRIISEEYLMEQMIDASGVCR